MTTQSIPDPNTLSAAASDLLALVERESEAWPFVGTVEVDGDVLSVRSFTDPRGVLMLGKHYTLVGIRGVKTLSRIDALRCLEAYIRRETESAVVAAGELVMA